MVMGFATVFVCCISHALGKGWGRWALCVYLSATSAAFFFDSDGVITDTWPDVDKASNGFGIAKLMQEMKSSPLVRQHFLQTLSQTGTGGTIGRSLSNRSIYLFAV